MIGQRIDDKEVIRRANFYLENWGSWSAHGGNGKELGYGRSTLSHPGALPVPIDKLGEQVDRVLTILPTELVSLAVLIYQKRVPIKAARVRINLSQSALELKLRVLRWSVFVGIEKKD